MSYDNEEKIIQLKDINEGISYSIVTNDKDIDEFFTQRNYESAFSKAYMNYSKIRMHELENKELIEEMSEVLDQYFLNLSGRPTNEKEQLMVGKMRIEVKQLVKEYINEVRTACHHLGLWLKIFRKNIDLDLQFSRETFGTDIQLLNEKKQDLATIDTQEFINLLDVNQIHRIHSRYLIKRALERE